MNLEGRLADKLEQARARFAQVEHALSIARDGAEIARLSKEYAELKPLADALTGLDVAKLEVFNLTNSLSEYRDDPEYYQLAKQELADSQARYDTLTHSIKKFLVPRSKDADASIILEIRAGTGGDEAALFAGVLFRMYQRYAQSRGWVVDIEDANETELGGYREITASIIGSGVFDRFEFESGVHRVQRVPETEASGRIHTSAATVAVLPEPDEVDVAIDERDIRIDTMRASGAGGQHVNKTDSAVRITHVPTGVVVVSAEKSQHQNRAKAMKVLRAKLYDLERARLDALRAADRKGKVGSGDRSERIRTYNFPQGRVTDHRINLTVYNLPEVINGLGLDPIIDALRAEDQATRLAQVEEGGA